MTAQKGKDLLLKVDSNGAGSFITVAGLRARTLAFNAATVDVTDTESAGRWRELLDGAGVKTARITGSLSGNSIAVAEGAIIAGEIKVMNGATPTTFQEKRVVELPSH